MEAGENEWVAPQERQQLLAKFHARRNLLAGNSSRNLMSGTTSAATSRRQVAEANLLRDLEKRGKHMIHTPSGRQLVVHVQEADAADRTPMPVDEAGNFVDAGTQVEAVNPVEASAPTSAHPASRVAAVEPTSPSNAVPVSPPLSPRSPVAMADPEASQFHVEDMQHVFSFEQRGFRIFTAQLVEQVHTRPHGGQPGM